MSYRLSALAMCAVFAVASVCQASLGPLQVKIDDGVDPAIVAALQERLETASPMVRGGKCS